VHRRQDPGGSGGQVEIAHEPLVSCFWCERLHPAKHPLSVCPACEAKCATVRLLEMSGSYPLSDDAIDHALMRLSPGNYALGYMDGDSFAVFYVGRSDSDLKRCLHGWVGLPNRYENFRSSAKAPWGTHRRGQLPMDVPALDRVENVKTSYTHFAYSYARSAEEAYAKEWRNYDVFGGRKLDNETQPISPATDETETLAQHNRRLENRISATESRTEP